MVQGHKLDLRSTAERKILVNNYLFVINSVLHTKGLKKKKNALIIKYEYLDNGICCSGCRSQVKKQLK